MINLDWSVAIIMSIILLILIIICIIFEIHLYISKSIHNSYHKGYNKAKDDKVQYYKTIKEIIDSFNEIFLELTKEGSSNMYKAHTLELMIDFKVSLQDYYNN